MKQIQSVKKPTGLIIGLLALGILFQSNTGFAQTPPAAAPAETSSNAPAPMPTFGSRGVGAHDPSTIVKDGNEFWVFYTGRGVPSYRSKDLVNWTRGPAVFTNAPAWKNEAVPANRGINFWAPDIMHVGDHWLLYYAVSSFGSRDSAIGLATNPTLDPSDPKFQWTDQGMVIKTTMTNNYNAIDPAIFLDANGELWMSFGSFWSGIKLVQLDPKTGKRIAPDSPVYSLAHTDEIEASYLYQHENYYYLFVNWGRCCRGANSTYNIRVGRSSKVTGPYLDQDGTDMLAGGGTLVLGSMGRFIGPGHAGIISDNGTNWLSFHYESDPTSYGRSTLAMLPLQWSTNGWPEVITNSAP